MNEPESYAPEGGWMGVTLRQTEVDLEDTSARMRRYEDTLRRIETLAVAVSGGMWHDDDGVLELVRHIQRIASEALNPD